MPWCRPLALALLGLLLAHCETSPAHSALAHKPPPNPAEGARKPPPHEPSKPHTEQHTEQDLRKKAASATQAHSGEAQSAAPDVRSVLREMPETEPWADRFKLWSEAALGEALSRKDQPLLNLAPYEAAPARFRWSPEPGKALVLLSGDTPEGASLLAYRPAPRGGKPTFAGSYRTQGEHTPIMLAQRPDKPSELLFSTCWGCGGEGGAIALDAAGKLRFSPR